MQNLVKLIATTYFSQAKEDFYHDDNSLCPICGGKKLDPEKFDLTVCIKCQQFDAEADEPIIAFTQSLGGHKDAMKGKVERQFITGAVFANLKLPSNAKLMTPDPKENIQPYLQFGVPVIGGKLNVSVFGAKETDAGKKISGVIELKSKITPAGKVYYLRVQKTEGVISDADLRIGNYGEAQKCRCDLPSFDGKSLLYKGNPEKERLIRFSIGFVAAADPAAQTAQ